MSRILIFANGDLADPGAARAMVRPDDLVIAADGGARHALSLGIIPTAIIGDMDSLSPEEVRDFIDMDVHLLRYPKAKDETDLELALNYALHAGHSPIIIIGALGGRLDQELGNISMLARPDALQVDVRLDDGWTEAFFISSKAFIHGKPGDTVSLFAWGAQAEGVTTDGLVFPLLKDNLYPYCTRSISNQMLADIARVSVKQGLILCVHIRNNR